MKHRNHKSPDKFKQTMRRKNSKRNKKKKKKNKKKRKNHGEHKECLCVHEV